MLSTSWLKELLESMKRCTGCHEILHKTALNAIQSIFNPLLNDIILNKTRLKAFADDKLIVAVMMISLCDRVINTVGKGENAGDEHYLLFPQRVPKPFSNAAGSIFSFS